MVKDKANAEGVTVGFWSVATVGACRVRAKAKAEKEAALAEAKANS